MCLIIHKPATRQIDEEFLRQAWRRNADGWGIFHLQDGRPVWAKGLKLDELIAHHARLPAHVEAYVHLRQATYGAINPAMAHPFVVREDLLLMHNGSLDELAPEDTSRSDTAELARLLGTLLQGLSSSQAAALIRSEGFARLVAPLIGGSRLVLLDSDGAVRLGRPWHRLARQQWSTAMHGIEVSNLHAWQPRDRLLAWLWPCWLVRRGLALAESLRGLARLGTGLG